MCVLEVAAAEVAAAEARRAAQAAQAELDDPSMADFLIWTSAFSKQSQRSPNNLQTLDLKASASTPVGQGEADDS